MRTKRLIGLSGVGAALVLITLVMTHNGDSPFMELANRIVATPEHQVADHGITGTATASNKALQVAQLRPAAPGPSPEEEALKKLPPPARPEHLQQPSKEEMEQRCMQNPNCRQKLEQFKQGKRPSTPLPAATAPSPEEKQLKQLPPPAQAVPPAGPRSEVTPGATDWLLSWLNPFGVGLAEAQTAFSVYLTPQTSFVATGNSYLYIVAGVHYYYGHYLYPGATYPNTAVENKPYVYFNTSFPAQGSYLIDVAASSALVKLRHLYNGPILDTWDNRGVSCPSNICHYVTVDYYAAGYQYWYFWATEYAPWIYSVTIRSYP